MKGKLALVTGASSGIGKATAERLARRGATVLLLARSGDKLAAVATGIKAGDGRAHAYPVDLSDAIATEATADAIMSAQGIPDIVVNNAGAGRWLPLAETSPDEARQMIELPYLAAFTVTRAFLPGMAKRGSGQIAFVTSPASYIVWPNASAYIAARFALRGFSEALRAETRGTGVGVTLTMLGTVASPYWEHNLGSRQYMPKAPRWLIPELSVDQAAATIVDAIQHRRARVVRPAFYRVLFALGLGR